MARLRSDFWVAAYLRRCASQAVPAYLRGRGSAESGAILIKIDRLDGTAALFGPAPQTDVEDNASERRFARMHAADQLTGAEVEARIGREMAFDPDVWLVEVEDRAGRTFLD